MDVRGRGRPQGSLNGGGVEREQGPPRRDDADASAATEPGDVGTRNVFEHYGSVAPQHARGETVGHAGDDRGDLAERLGSLATSAAARFTRAGDGVRGRAGGIAARRRSERRARDRWDHLSSADRPGPTGHASRPRTGRAVAVVGGSIVALAGAAGIVASRPGTPDTSPPQAALGDVETQAAPAPRGPVTPGRRARPDDRGGAPARGEPAERRRPRDRDDEPRQASSTAASKPQAAPQPVVEAPAPEPAPVAATAAPAPVAPVQTTSSAPEPKPDPAGVEFGVEG